MGTRHIIAVVKDNELKVSQYGQWDGYFSCKGIMFIEWVKQHFKKQKRIQDFNYYMNKFREKLDCCKPVTEAWFNKFFEAVKQFSVTSDSNKDEYGFPMLQLMPVFHRDTSVDILDIIDGIRDYEYNYEPKKYFPVYVETDLGMVEYIYVLDMDKECIYCLTCHDFDKEVAGKQLELPEVVTENYAGYDVFYSSPIIKLPSIKKITEIVSPMNL